jgi:hypothetical protein
MNQENAMPEPTTTPNPSGRCACGHVLDRSTDATCRHCARSPEERAARVARAGKPAAIPAPDLAPVAEAARFEADFLASLDARFLARRAMTPELFRQHAIAAIRDARDAAQARALEGDLVAAVAS